MPGVDLLVPFDGGPDVERLKKEAARLTSSSRSLSTARAYEGDFADFRGWCESAKRKAMPASAETLELYIVDRLRRHSLATIERRVIGVRAVHLAAGHPSPYTNGARDVLRGARRELGSAQASKAALRVEDLRAICRSLNSARPSTAVRDRAILTLGFAAALRRSELVGLDLADVDFVAKGMLVRIRRSKTDQEGRGRAVGVFNGTRAAYSCPVKCLRAWIRIRGRAPGPLFPSEQSTSGRLTAEMVNQVVKRSVELLGLDPRRYGAHSLRAGFVTAAAEAGVPESLIMQRTGHRSIENVAKYVRPASVFSSDALARAL